MSKDKTLSVFVADDDEDDRFLMKMAFDVHCPEAKIEFAVDGLDLMSALNDSLSIPCLIILDLNMPRLNGLDSLKLLRSSESYQHTPIVVLSTSNDKNDIRMAHDLGANEYVVKPINMKALGELVNRLKVEWNLVECQ
jgi:CheY-like chemotaxis protein